MAYNGSHQNSDTEVFLAKTELEGESKDNKNLDYVDDFLNVNMTVQNEIWRGKKLRAEKPKPDETENEYFVRVPDINFFESVVNQPRARKGHLETFKNRSSQSTPRSRCPCTRRSSPASSYLMINRISTTNTMQTKAKKGKRCPMRIAELAVPTKRQCIETWRNKSDVLPELMVERLKQHIMDQSPIVKIPEAIYCFQNAKRVESKNCSFRWLSSKHKLSDTLKHSHQSHQSHQMDARMLCILFAHKVTKRLSRPISSTLNPDLQKLATIVSSDIAKIMSKCQCTTSKGRQYKAIHTDVSNKITVWITGILEDLSYKLLEEDLRVKMETEAQIKTMLKFSDRIVTIIETIIEQENCMKTKDLEEEEGPVLDFIDEVVQTVMNICEPPQLHIDSDSSGSKKDVLLGEESDKMSKLEEINSKTSTQVLTEKTDDGLINLMMVLDSNENLTDSEHFRKEISKIIDYIIIKESGEDMSNGSGDDIENGSGDDNEEVSVKAEMEHNTNDENIEGISPEAGIEHDVNDENNDKILPEAGVEHDVNDENNDKILPEAGVEHDVNDEINDKILPEAGVEHDVNDENNDKILPEAGLEHDVNDENNDVILPEAGVENDVNDENNDKIFPEAEMKQDIRDDDNVGISPEPGIEHDTNDEKFNEMDENSPNVDENDEARDNAAETHSNVSERFEIFSDDSDDDKNSKKVMFPKKDLVNPDNPAEQIKNSAAEEPAPEHDEHKQPRWNHQNNKSTIIFAEPNQNLLSDADESWPADLSDRPMLKVSESASKSVSSLGRITENDEKQMSSLEDEDSMTDKRTGDKILQLNDIMEKLDNMVTQVDSKILDKKDTGKTITVSKTCDDISVDESSKLKKYLTDSGESELIRTGSSTDRTEDDKIPSHKSQSQVDYGWKVHPKSAPSWVSWGQGRGEPSEDSIPIQRRPAKVTEIELRKWCKELEKGFTNLEMWSNWISATCKESLCVLQQKEFNCPALAQKGSINWIRLKRNIHKDALLWTKLFQRTDKNFKSLKNKYNNIEFSSNKVPSILNRTIFEKMCEFEELSVKLHKMIVAAEYCAMCTCDKTKTRRHLNSKYLGYRTK